MKTNSTLAKAAFLLILVSQNAWAQTSPRSMRATYNVTSEYVRNIPALSQMDNIISAQGFEHVAPPKRRGANRFVPGKGFPRGGDRLAARQLEYNRTSSNRVTSEVTEVANFDAHRGTVLNDPTGAIGPNHYVYAFNSGFGILDRSGNVLVAEASLATLFPGESLGDPVVMYDQFAGRFIIMQFSDTPNGILIAVCQGADPVNDGWYTFRFNTGSFPDYEKMSIWHDGYYITANKNSSSAGTSEVVYALERDQMLAGNSSARMIGFPLPGITTSGFYSPGGLNALGSTLPPSNVKHQVIYMQDDSWSGVSQDHLKIWETTVDWNNTSNSSIELVQELNTTPFDGVFNGGSFNNLPEPGGGRLIDALQATMMFMTNYRRFSTYNSVVLNFVVDVNGNDDLAGIRWYELRQTSDGADWTIYQEGTYTDPDGYNAFSGSITMDVQGNIGMGYTVVSSSKHLSIRYTGRLVGDQLSVMTSPAATAVDGDARSNRGDGRYGDYAQITMDPTDDLTFWHIGEYMSGPSNSVRRSRVVAFRLGESVPDDDAPTTPTNLTVSNVGATSATLSWGASTDSIGVAAYDIYSDTTVIASASGSVTTYTLTGLTPGTDYSVYIRARDAAGNLSSASNTVDFETIQATSCTGGITSYPYTQGFEGTIGSWSQNTGDDLNWLVNPGGTPSNNTGPSSASEGSDYIYVEASGNDTGFPNKTAIITSPCFDLSGLSEATFSFDYHMYGSSDMGTIDLEVSVDDGNSWTSIWDQSGNQGNQWNDVDVDLSSYVGGTIQLRFNRVTGGTWQADIAIDDVSLSSGSTGTPDDCAAAGDLTLTLVVDNYPQETSWEITNASGSVVASESYTTATPDGSTVTESIDDLSAGDYTFTINDSYGDGICCQYGTGSYVLEDREGNTIAEGGEFGSSEDTEFCLSTRAVRGQTSKIETEVLDQSANFTLFPNTTKRFIKIEANGDDIDKIQIFSMFGRAMEIGVGGYKIKTAANENTYDVSELPSGTYFLRITSNGKAVTKKFIKE